MRKSKIKSISLSVVVILLLTQFNTEAQVRRFYGFKIGVVGANETWNFYGPSDWATSTRWGMTMSAYAELPLSRYLGAIGEIQYSQKGMTYTTSEITDVPPFSANRTFSPRVDYLSIPILAKLRLPLINFVPYVIVGPRFDFLVYRNGDGLDAAVNQFDSMDYGLTVGGGVELNSVFPFGLLAEFRYNPNVYDSYSSPSQRVRNYSMDFLVGVRL